MEKLIIFGGSFDPVHKAHTGIVKELCARFDRVVVVPCRISPFKTGTSADAGARLDMLKLALKGSAAEISTFELESAAPSYSYLTAEHFSADNVKLYFAIGGEMLPQLRHWKNFAELSRLVRFYVIPRPEFILDKNILDGYADTDLEIAGFAGGEGSSSEVKISVAMNETERFLDAEVAAYIKTNGLYRDYAYVSGLYKKYGLSPGRIKHSFSTALCGVSLAKRMDIDPVKAATALLLHDIGKNVTAEDAGAMGVKLDAHIYAMPEKVRHAEIGAEILAQKEGVTDAEIIEAVRWHTTGKADMSPLDIVVYLADIIEPLRHFDGVDSIRQTAAKSVLGGLREALHRTVTLLPQDKIYFRTKEAYEYYCKLT